ncbi:hypothetical protein ABZ851_30530 [Streptomyces sp. NPDC047049]|uniref:hypothetical protein n=1 Tax=Streptomyces sp. NPDC047049 TaxID=3156688 RepID=UPI0033DCB6AA
MPRTGWWIFGESSLVRGCFDTFEQQVIDLELKLQDRDNDLAAARAANRELMAQINRDPARQEE